MQFALVTDYSIAGTDTGTISIGVNGQLINNGAIQEFNVFTPAFVPAIANAEAAMVTAAVAAFQQAFGVSLPRTSVVLPTLQQGS